jgi:hypothetical protein
MTFLAVSVESFAWSLAEPVETSPREMTAISNVRNMAHSFFCSDILCLSTDGIYAVYGKRLLPTELYQSLASDASTLLPECLLNFLGAADDPLHVFA